MTEQEIRDLLRDMREEPVPADSQARVRMAVAERSQNWAEKFRRHWRIVAGVLVPACAVLVAMLAREPARVGIRSAAAPQTASVVPEVSVSAAPDPPRRVVTRVRKPRSTRHKDVEASDTVIRIETADPDVVILLVGG